MKAQHTLGPWNISKLASPDYAPQFGIYAGDGAHRDHAIITGNNAEANAQLIASAPELLAAAVAHLDAYGENACECIDNHEPSHCPHCQLRATIARATQP